MGGNGGGKGGGSGGGGGGKGCCGTGGGAAKSGGVALRAVAVVARWLLQGVEEDHAFQGTLFKVIPRFILLDCMLVKRAKNSDVLIRSYMGNYLINSALWILYIICV